MRRFTRSAVTGAGLVLVCVLLAFFPSAGSFASARGLWLSIRRDPGNSARSDVPGRIARPPREFWRYGAPASTYTYLKPLTIRGKRLYFAQIRRGLALIKPDGGAVWRLPALGVSRVDSVFTPPGSRSLTALVQIGDYGLALLDVEKGRMLWQWSVPDGAYLGGCRLLHLTRRTLLVVFPQNTSLGVCFEIPGSNQRPRLLWKRDYRGRFWVNFGPYFVFSDLDNDRLPEIVLVGKPGYVGAVDALTGDVKFDLKYVIHGGDDIGRPYGLIRSADLDGDGFRDVVVVGCQVEHYISVIRNLRGKGFELVWSKYLGYDLPLPESEAWPDITSLADVDGDRKPELVMGVFNPDGDSVWHTIAFDVMKGYGARTVDLPGRCFRGCCDINGDRRPDIIVSEALERIPDEPAAVEAVDGRSLKLIASVPSAGFQISNSRLRPDTEFKAVRRTPLCVTAADGRRGLVLNTPEGGRIWRVRDGHYSLTPFSLNSFSRAVLNTDNTGVTGPLDLRIGGSDPDAVSASWPLVCESGGSRELILALSDGTLIGGQPDFSRPGSFARKWTAPGTMPTVWGGSRGRRIVCAVDKSADVVHLHDPERSRSFAVPHPIYRSNSLAGAALLAYGADDMRLFVGFRLGPHPVASACYDEHGRQIWSDPENGPYPRLAAAGDLNSDGQEEVFVDNHGKHIIYDGSGNGRVVAQGWHDTIPGRGDGCKYALPVIGPYGPNGESRIVLTPGLDALEVLDGSGARIAKSDFADTYAFDSCTAAVASLRGGGFWDVGVVSRKGVFHCADVQTCRTRWTLDLGCRAWAPFCVTAGDVDGDGRDNFLVGMPNGKLAALDEINGRGRVLWTCSFDAGVSNAYLADVDGDGAGEIVAELDDGTVRLLR